MFICLTDFQLDTPIVIRCDQIVCVLRDSETRLNTMVITSILTQKGPKAFVVKEDIQEVGLRLNRAFKAEVPAADLGFKIQSLMS